MGTFTEEEATACFASYAGLDEANANSDAVKEIVARLGSIPLAIAMAALYFRNAAGTVDELSAEYFAQLEALEDIGSIPPGFDRTAFAAIEHAVRHLGAGIIGHDRIDVKMVEGMLYRAALLAPDMIPLNYLIASMPEDIQIRLGHLPEPAFADAAQRRRYISIMRTQSIAHRVLLLDDDGVQNEASDTIDIHPLVHEILQRLFMALLTDPWVLVSAWQCWAVAAEGEHGQGDERFRGAESERDPGQQPDLGVGRFDQSLR